MDERNRRRKLAGCSIACQPPKRDSLSLAVKYGKRNQMTTTTILMMMEDATRNEWNRFFPDLKRSLVARTCLPYFLSGESLFFFFCSVCSIALLVGGVVGGDMVYSLFVTEKLIHFGVCLVLLVATAATTGCYCCWLGNHEMGIRDGEAYASASQGKLDRESCQTLTQN